MGKIFDCEKIPVWNPGASNFMRELSSGIQLEGYVSILSQENLMEVKP